MFLRILLWLIAFVLLGLSISVAPWYKLWLFELVGAGYICYAALTLILMLSLFVFKLRPSQHKGILVLAVALGFYASNILYWYIPKPQNMGTGGTPLTVMAYNVNYKLWDTEAVTKSVRSHPVDIFGLVEPSKEQAAKLRNNVQDIYPQYYRATGGGLSLFSRYPIINAKTDNLKTRYHSLFATLDINGKLVQVVVTHPLAPVTKQNFIQRNEAMVALAKYGAQQQLSTIIMGDFNTTSWSVYFRDFVERSRLRNANLGHGLNPTWFYNGTERSLSPDEQLKQILKIPIDHIFVSQNIQVDQVVTLHPGVSDHRPIMAKLRIF